MEEHCRVIVGHGKEILGAFDAYGVSVDNYGSFSPNIPQFSFGTIKKFYTVSGTSGSHTYIVITVSTDVPTTILVTRIDTNKSYYLSKSPSSLITEVTYKVEGVLFTSSDLNKQIPLNFDPAPIN